MNIDFSTLNFSTEAKAVTELWASLPRKTGFFCPEKSSFSPVSLGKHLKSIFMFERSDADTLLVRVAGSEIREHLGHELTGKNLFETLPTEYAYSYREYYNSLQALPCAGVVKRPAAKSGGGRQLLKTLHLPLLDVDGIARYFVGALKVERLPLHFEEIKNGIMAPRMDLEMLHIDLGAGLPGMQEQAEPSCA